MDGLRKNPNIELIEQDAPRYLMGQTTPYGVPMVQAPTLVSTGADGTGIKVCIIDSGIKADHEDFAGISMTAHNRPDLRVRVSLSLTHSVNSIRPPSLISTN